jgi:hypothetical protein
MKVDMGAKTVRKYRADRLPSESFTPRTWRTREDPFEDGGFSVLGNDLSWLFLGSGADESPGYRRARRDAREGVPYRDHNSRL